MSEIYMWHRPKISKDSIITKPFYLTMLWYYQKVKYRLAILQLFGVKQIIEKFRECHNKKKKKRTSSFYRRYHAFLNWAEKCFRNTHHNNKYFFFFWKSSLADGAMYVWLLVCKIINKVLWLHCLAICTKTTYATIWQKLLSLGGTGTHQ